MTQPDPVRNLIPIILAAALFLPSYSSIAAPESSTPDFSGLWFPRAGFGRTTPNPLPYTEQAQKLHDRYLQEFTPDDDPGKFCIMPGLPRAIWGAPFAIEILQTEREVTIFYEGYFMYRKIYIEGYPRPEPILPTRMGYSVGRWDGDVLTIETTHLREYPYMIRIPNTAAAKVTERMYIEMRDNGGVEEKWLVDELTLVDPALYTEPVVTKGAIKWSPETPIMEYSCSETIWDEYLLEHELQVPDFEQLLNN
jgi:hypothetical protein